MNDDLATLAAELVRHPSPNPPGDERACATFIAEWLADAGIEATLLEEPDQSRPSVGATIGSGDPTIVLNGHTDVVPVEDAEAWSVDPYGGVIEDGRLYGRGSADMKTGLAVALLAASSLAPELRDADDAGSLVVHAAAGEETGYPGTQSLIEAGFTGDMGVVLEPTDLRVATRAKGVSTFRLDIGGEPSHASRPDQGHNPIDDLRAVIDAVSSWDASIRTREDRLCGRAYATVTEVAAGVENNMAVIPGRASMLVDRRVLPEESLETVRAELDRVIERLQSGGIEVEASLVQHYAPSAVDEAAPVVTTLRERSAAVAGIDPEPIGLEAATDARDLAAAGADAVIWGPGSLAQAHTIDESTDLESASIAQAILEDALRQLLGLDD